MTTSAVPAHVPAELVSDFDFRDMQGAPDPYLKYAQLHAGPDIFYSSRYGGHWILTRYEDMEHFLENHQDFSNEQAFFPLPKGAGGLFLLPEESDPPLHTEYRAILAPYFSPKSIGNLEQRAREIMQRLLDEWYAKGECEFVSAFAFNMPIAIFMRLTGLPDSDAPLLVGFADGVIHGETAEIQQTAYAQMVGYIGEQIAERRRNPGNGMLDAMINARIDGGRAMTDGELIGMGCLLLIGGLDTVASMLGFATMFLAQNDGHRRQLVENPALINDAAEELMRRHHLGVLGRQAKHDLEYKGIAMKAGDVALALTPLAGLDERHYPEPFKIDFSRKDKKHLVFSRGPHICIGSFLARTEIRMVMAEWLKRIPEFSIKPGTTPVVVAGKGPSVKSLHLQWQPN